MASRFSDRIALWDEGTEDFLKSLAHLGGYCGVEQAQRLGLAHSPARASVHSRRLEHGGFLRRVSQYPVVYQVTKSVCRVLGKDLTARRAHAIETVRARLLAVNFYLEAIHWPAEFVFDHEQKVRAFRELGCPESILPQRSGKPYLWEDFVLRQGKGVCVAFVDHFHRTAFFELQGLIKRYDRCLEELGEGFKLMVVVESEARYRLFCRLLRHPRLQKLSQARLESSISLYRVRTAVPSIRSLSWPSRRPTESGLAVSEPDYTSRFD